MVRRPDEMAGIGARGRENPLELQAGHHPGVIGVMISPILAGIISLEARGHDHRAHVKFLLLGALVVGDGRYQIRVAGENNSILGSLPVTVDNNQSPLTDAIGTKYLAISNLTCMLPYIYDNAWKWFPDESGILFRSDGDPNVPQYPEGLYTMAPNGDDIVRIVPMAWRKGGDPVYDYAFSNFELSPDGEKVAFIVDRRYKSGYFSESQLWVVDRDGRNLTRVDAYSTSYIEDLRWAPDNEALVFSIYTQNHRFELRSVRKDGSGKAVIDSALTENDTDFVAGWFDSFLSE